MTSRIGATRKAWTMIGSPSLRAEGGFVRLAAGKRPVPTGVAGTTAKPLVLLLQGPVGPFFAALHRSLLADGCDVLKVNFNGGDWLYSHSEATLTFAGTVAQWTGWLESFVTRSKPQAIVLFGDRRPYHRAAIDVAERAGIQVWCLEEGYSRPKFVTCEPHGNNARSPLRQMTGAPAVSAAEPAGIEALSGNLFKAMALNAVAYFVAKTLAAPVFRNAAHHRKRTLLAETVLWSRCFVRKLLFYHANAKLLQNVVEHLDARYFVVALQVHDDQQLVCHGRGWTMERLVSEAIQSFARHAAPQAHLVFKVHPMDRGHRSYRPFIVTLARLAGCDARVHVIDDGSIGLLIRHSLGLVTVNSTSGLSALNHGKPLLALGEALYGVEGLVNGAGTADCLDRFWTEATPPEPAAVERFMARMHAESLVPGSFYLRAAIEPTSRRVAQRIRAAMGGQVIPFAAGMVEDDTRPRRANPPWPLAWRSQKIRRPAT